MRKLPEVEDAKALMKEAMDWSVFTWLWEKRRVRQTADMANHVLDQSNKKIKKSWSDESRAAYRTLVEESRGKGRTNKKSSESSDGQLMLLVQKAKEADDEAHRARIDAEATFDEADRQMSVSLAVEGCEKAIRSWELHERAIRKAEAVLEFNKSKDRD